MQDSRNITHAPNGTSTIILQARRFVVGALLIFFGALVAGCSDGHQPSPTEPRPPGSPSFAQWTNMVSGNAQTGGPGESLAPLVVRVTDNARMPIGNATVFWNVLRGDGELATRANGGRIDDCCDAVTTTDSNGVTEVRFTLGVQPGINVIEAASFFSANRVTFVATTDA